MSTNVEESIGVNLPVSTVYNQWTLLEQAVAINQTEARTWVPGYAVAVRTLCDLAVTACRNNPCPVACR